MSDLTISQITYAPNIDVYSIRHIMSSNALTDAQKAKFIVNNQAEIKAVMKTTLSSDEYNIIMNNRHLLIYKPLRNAFTKRGDKVLLAQALGVSPQDIELYLKETTSTLQKTGNLDFINGDKDKCLSTYVFRHGTKEQLLTFFDYQLRNARNIEKTIKDSLNYGNGGIADYFYRPIHRLNDKTMAQLSNVIFTNINNAVEKGLLTESDANELASYALTQMYIIQENNHPIKKKIKSMLK